MKSFLKDHPDYSKFFNFEQFNAVQLKCYKPVCCDSRNMVVSAPTSSGKTVIFELAIINQLATGQLRCLYLAPIKSLCHEKSMSWSQKFRGKLNMFELTSDTSAEQQSMNQLQMINLVVATPQKIDAYSRKSLDFISKLNLLLIDEVHMLNFQQRGATLQAVVSRIISLSNPRIIAVSATIPNIKEVAQWLHVTPGMTLVFGEQYRPVKINKVVLGFKSSNNPYTFQKMLNYKLTQVIRSYSQEKGVLVFCQTQKGTEMACQQVISDMREREFIDSDQTLLALIQGSKRVSNSTLQIMLPQGVAFHNAGLSLQDRLVVQKLFLDNKIRILCTTSTLAMGINLPARLVVIKSTQCYRGSGKGYQEYTQIQMDQMTGRAGRPPFDNEGTVVIMTEKKNYNKYLNSGKLQTLESHLYHQLAEHINAQISLRSLKCFKDVLKYFMNSFCYIRMKNTPASYSIKGNITEHVEKVCMESIQKLNTYNLIRFHHDNQVIVSRPLGINVARNSIQIQTIVTILKEIQKIKSQRDFLSLLCQSQEIKRYRNKLDQRKLLKQINEKNKYIIKTAIANPQKKCYVLVQCELDGRHIENWQLRKQSKQMIYFLRRLTFCVKTACSQLKLFWPFFWSCMTNKYFTLKFWDRNETMTIKQFQQLNQKWKMLSAKGFKNLQHLMSNLQHLDTICQKNSQFSQSIARKVNNLKQSVIIRASKTQGQKLKQNNQKFQNQTDSQADFDEPIDRPMYSNKDTLLTITFCGTFDEQFKSILILVGQANELYTIRTLKEGIKQTTIAVSSDKKYHLAVIKNGFIGFDQFFQISNGKDIKPIADISTFMDGQSNDKMNNGHKKKQKQKGKDKNITTDQQQTSKKKQIKPSVSKSVIKKPVISASSSVENKKPRRSQSNKWIKFSEEVPNVEQSNTIKMIHNEKPKRANKNYPKIISRKKRDEQMDSNDDEWNKVSVKPGSYIPLNEYKCWKPGFRKFSDSSDSEQQTRLTMHKPLLLVQETSSKSKQNLELHNMATVKSKTNVQWGNYVYQPNLSVQMGNNIEREQVQKQKNRKQFHREQQQIVAPKKKQITNSNPYDYFSNLFNR